MKVHLVKAAGKDKARRRIKADEMRARQAIRAHLQYVEKDVQASWDRVDAAECTESPASSSFTASINKMLKQTHPHMGLTVEGMHTMQDFVVYLLERLVDAAAAHHV